MVRVTNPDCKRQADFQRWLETLAKGTVVMIDGAKAQPREVDIFTGQTGAATIAACPAQRRVAIA